MARKPFVVIDAEILSSSVWSEAAHVRLVWITLLILCDTDGYVGASVPGIARAAGVTLEEAQEAVAVLQQPDPHSRTKSNEGRRLEPDERGWRILNFKEHLDRLSAERAKSRDRVRKFRERSRMKRHSADGNVTVPTGKREQGIGNRDENGRTEDPTSSLPGVVREGGVGGEGAEQAIRAHRVRMERRLYELVGLLAQKHSDKDPVEIMRTVTSWTGKDGKERRGMMRPELLSDERLEKSILDAEGWLDG